MHKVIKIIIETIKFELELSEFEKLVVQLVTFEHKITQGVQMCNLFINTHKKWNIWSKHDSF